MHESHLTSHHHHHHITIMCCRGCFVYCASVFTQSVSQLSTITVAGCCCFFFSSFCCAHGHRCGAVEMLDTKLLCHQLPQTHTYAGTRRYSYTFRCNGKIITSRWESHTVAHMKRRQKKKEIYNHKISIMTEKSLSFSPPSSSSFPPKRTNGGTGKTKKNFN